eukprot:1179927-Alexandrium_andersonii.AAC.1
MFGGELRLSPAELQKELRGGGSGGGELGRALPRGLESCGEHPGLGIGACDVRDSYVAPPGASVGA